MPVLFHRTRIAGGVVQGWPCGGPITSMFGARDTEAHVEGHSGVDIGAAEGVSVCAPASGVVRDVFIDACRGTRWDAFKDIFGDTVILDHVEAGYVTLYGHLRDAPLVLEGQIVAASAMLGVVGSTGTSTGPHLHWGMAPRLDGGTPSYLPRSAVVDPIEFGGPEATETEVLAERLDALAAEATAIAAALRMR
ncbi:MAG: M23 family metallopeptidase [Dehalococcoidia bacterium]|nr:M23 family metallopeptidase [Dehalococcoidia bacterium]